MSFIKLSWESPNDVIFPQKRPAVDNIVQEISHVDSSQSVPATVLKQNKKNDFDKIHFYFLKGN